MSLIQRHPLLTGALLAALVGLVAWLWWPRPAVDLPRLSAAEVAALEPTADDDRRLLVHLSALALGRGADLSGWRRLPEPARHVWATLCIESELTTGEGLGNVIRRRAGTVPDPDHRPTLEEASVSYAAIGCADLAAYLRTTDRELAAGRTPGDFAARFTVLLPAGRAARVAYQRRHVAELAP